MLGALQVGDVLRGKYRVERVLGRGGMGMVVAATHLQLGREVAIKLLLPEMLQSAEVVERFLREARAASRLESEHVARVFDVDRLDSGEPFLVMEYLEGSDLSFVRQQGRPLPSALAVDYLLQACKAIEEAHALGIIHRDLKPPNLFLAKRRDGSTVVKVLDFGISKLLDQGTGSGDGIQTRPLQIMGSPEYMAPEQMLASKDVDPRSDVWALGVTLYELLTAHSPFAGDSLPAISIRVVNGPVASLRTLVPGVPESLDRIVLQCLEKDPKNRFRSVAELSERLGVWRAKTTETSIPGAAPGAPRAPLALAFDTAPAVSSTMSGGGQALTPVESPRESALRPATPVTTDPSRGAAPDRRRVLFGGALVLVLTASMIGVWLSWRTASVSQGVAPEAPLAAGPSGPPAVPPNGVPSVVAASPPTEEPGGAASAQSAPSAPAAPAASGTAGVPRPSPPSSGTPSGAPRPSGKPAAAPASPPAPQDPSPRPASTRRID